MCRNNRVLNNLDLQSNFQAKDLFAIVPCKEDDPTFTTRMGAKSRLTLLPS
jgi:hypothetical protein